MPEQGRDAGRTDRERLDACLRDVSLARGRLRAARHEGARSHAENPLRATLLTALEGYAAAITQLGAPVPYRLTAEIEMYRRLGRR